MTPQEAAAQLDSPDAAARQQAADYLSRQGEAVRDVAAAVARQVGDPDRIVAEFCVSALEEMGPPNPAQLPALASLLAAAHSDVVYWSATLLGRAKAESAPYAVHLVEMIAADWPLPVRQRGAWALRQIGSGAVSVIPQLQELVPRLPESLRRDVIQALAAIES